MNRRVLSANKMMEGMIGKITGDKCALPEEQLGCLKQMETSVVSMMEEACCGVEKLAAERAGCKLSNSRVMAVAKELRDLMKVLSACSY